MQPSAHIVMFVSEHRVECVYIVFWVDVQTGYVWAGIPLSVYFFGTNSGFCVQYLG